MNAGPVVVALPLRQILEDTVGVRLVPEVSCAVGADPGLQACQREAKDSARQEAGDEAEQQGDVRP
jgi:hypothetical protein